MGIGYRLLAIFVFLYSATCAAQTVCETVIPGNVILPDGRLIRHLAPSAIVNTDAKSVDITSFVEDDSPRRILLVLETTKEKRKEILQAEYDLAHFIVKNARPQDRFAVVSALGKRVEVPFQEDNSKALQAIDDLSNAKIRQYTQDGILDSIETSLRWFDPLQFGDAIIVIGSRTLANRFSNPEKLQKALMARGIRVFAVVTGPIEVGTFYSGFARFTAVPQMYSWFSPDFSNSWVLSFHTGGYAMVHPELDYYLASVKYDDSLRKTLEREGANIYLAITRTYRLSLKSTNAKTLVWKLGLTDDVKKDIPEAIILQPHALEPCAKKRD
jgi:hypothetical protein